MAKSTVTERGVSAPLLDLGGLASRLGVGERYVRRLVDERRIPYRKIGRLLRFDADEVEAWLEKCRVDPQASERAARRRHS